MPDPEPEVRVVNNPAEHRYEAWVGERRAGFVLYDERPGHLVFLHTEVDPSFEGHGIGGRLAAGALADVRARGFTLTPQCPFIADFIDRHAEYADLVAARDPAG